MKPQEDADREGRAADAVEMDVDAWASAQTQANRERITQIAMDNFHVHVENPWKLQVPPAKNLPASVTDSHPNTPHHRRQRRPCPDTNGGQRSHSHPRFQEGSDSRGRSYR